MATTEKTILSTEPVKAVAVAVTPVPLKVTTAPVAVAKVPTVVKATPAVKKAVSMTKTTAKPAAKAPAKVITKVAVKAPAKATIKTPAKPLVKALTKPKVEKTVKAKKAKLVRDSFTIPKVEYTVLDDLKQRAGKLLSSAKKSELIRAGIKALAAMSDMAFVAALKAVPAIKTGRPTKD